VTAPGSRAIVTREDVERAQAVLDAWKAEREQTAVTDGACLPYLRGLITQALTDAHAQGYDEGVVRGRRLVANTVRDALDGEGL
jgi:hypothetical protein